MSSKRYFALVLGALALAGCSTKNNTGTGGSGTTTAVSGSTSNTTGSSKVTSSTSSGTGGAAGNHTFATATMIKINDMPTAATLTDVKGQDFYSFTAKAGQRIIIEVAPQSQLNAPDPTVMDPAIGVYNAAGAAMGSMAMPITYQSGSWPGFSPNTSSLFVEIPKDDTYYVLVADCNGFFSMGCPNPASGVTTLDYAFFVGETSTLTNPEQVASSTNNSTTNAVDLAYKATTTAGQYYDNIIGGSFSSATETQVFKFTPPAAAMHTAGAQDRADFYVQIIGGNQGGDLSASNVKIWATDSSGTKIISQADQSHFLVDSTHYSPLDFSVPVTLGQTYYLFVQNTHTGGTATTDFYFIDGFLNALYDVAETEPNAGQKTGAQVLAAQGTAKDFYVVDGNLSPATESDWYSLAVPGGMTKYGFYCDSGRSGSGLGAFTAQLFQADGTTSIGTPQSETIDTDLFSAPVALPAGQTAGSTWYLKATAGSQDTTNTGAQYRCTVFFQP